MSEITFGGRCEKHLSVKPCRACTASAYDEAQRPSLRTLAPSQDADYWLRQFTAARQAEFDLRRELAAKDKEIAKLQAKLDRLEVLTGIMERLVGSL